MITHTQSSLERQGFQPTGIVQDEMPGYTRLCKTLMQLDLAHGSLTAFRMSGGAWEFYKTPNATAGFKDEPMFPAPKQ